MKILFLSNDIGCFEPRIKYTVRYLNLSFTVGKHKINYNIRTRKWEKSWKNEEELISLRAHDFFGNHSLNSSRDLEFTRNFIFPLFYFLSDEVPRQDITFARNMILLKER